jgi:hypothetical protein
MKYYFCEEDDSFFEHIIALDTDTFRLYGADGWSSSIYQASELKGTYNDSQLKEITEEEAFLYMI